MPGEEVMVEGYKWVGAVRQGRVGRGGVGILVSDDYAVVEEEGEALSKGFESVWAKISGRE